MVDYKMHYERERVVKSNRGVSPERTIVGVETAKSTQMRRSAAREAERPKCA